MITQHETVRAHDGGELIVPGVSDREHVEWRIHGRVDKYDLSDMPDKIKNLEASALESLGFVPSDVVEFEGNLLVNAGAARVEDLLIGAGGQAWNNTNCRIGVGNSATAATAADTDLNAAAGSSNRQFVVMDSTFPSRSGQTITFKATHTSGLSNFAWAEWAIDAGTANGTTVVATMLNHKVTALGTKTSAASWAFTVTLVIA